MQRRPWSVFRKPQFFHTFSVILILSNYRKCTGKSRFSKNWSWTSLHSRFRVLTVLFLWSYSFQRERIKYMNSGRNRRLWNIKYKSSNFPPSCPDYPCCNNERELLNTETPNKSPITCSKVLVVNNLKAVRTCCIGVSSRSVLANRRVLSKAKTRSKIFVIVFLQRVTSVPKEPTDECVQLFQERLSEKVCTPQPRKVIWDMINTPFLTL